MYMGVPIGVAQVRMLMRAALFSKTRAMLLPQKGKND
jgi:hypothetical protein